MLATLFDFPWEDRRKLTRWSDVATAAAEDAASIETEEQRLAELYEVRRIFRASCGTSASTQPPRAISSQ